MTTHCLYSNVDVLNAGLCIQKWLSWLIYGMCVSPQLRTLKFRSTKNAMSV